MIAKQRVPGAVVFHEPLAQQRRRLHADLVVDGFFGALDEAETAG
jgi:hypothetical protein